MKVLKKIQHPDGWCILPIHYSHDPEKDHDWVERARAKYDRDEDWQREMELDFTSQKGATAYPNFNANLHVKPKLPYSKTIPLCLACDFNVENVSWMVCQIRGGVLFVIDEICLGTATVEDMVTEFRNRYPDHAAEIHVYGDSMGTRRGMQTGKTDFQLIQLYMKGYPSRVVIKVPRGSPDPRARIDALNHKLKGVSGKPALVVAQRCVELIQDFQEVALNKTGKDVLKVYNESDPYSKRTHASDALGYMVYREWPISKELTQLRAVQKKRQPLTHKNLLKI